MRIAEPHSLDRRVDWNLLRTFIAIVEEGGITSAARRLHFTQPAVSNALRRLEQQLGRRLIDRGRGVFEINDSGRLLYREAVEIHGSISRLATLLRESSDEVSGHVTAALASHVVFPLFDETLADFHERHPGVTFTMEVDTSAVVVDALLQKSATFALCLVHERKQQLEYKHAYREYFGFFCGPSHRLFGRRGVKLGDLRGESFVSFKTDRLTDALRPVALLRARENIEGRIVGMSSHLEEVRRMIVAGFGIGPLPIHVVERDVRDGLLWQLPPYRNPPAIDIYLVTNPRTHLNRAERLLLEALRERIDATPARERSLAASLRSGPDQGSGKRRA